MPYQDFDDGVFFRATNELSVPDFPEKRKVLVIRQYQPPPIPQQGTVMHS